MTYYALIKAGCLPGGLLPGRDPGSGQCPIIATDPRRLEPYEVFDEIEEELLARTWELAGLEPCGLVADEDDLPECIEGWTITSRTADLSAMLGPQAPHILAAIAEAERTLVGCHEKTEAEAAIEVAYGEAVDAQYPPSGQVGQLDAALAALAERGADEDWWESIGSCQYGWEIAALAARDLIGTTPEWTQEAYDFLTRPWFTAFGRPVHPDDKTPAEKP